MSLTNSSSSCVVMDELWQELQTVREQVRDARDNAVWYGRKRDESRVPRDYVYYAKLCNQASKEQSELSYQESALHTRLLAMVDEEESNI
jgi:hypothetical protein